MSVGDLNYIPSLSKDIPLTSTSATNEANKTTAVNEESDFLSTPVIACVGNLATALSTKHSHELLQFETLDEKAVSDLAESVSHYQPLLFIVNVNSTTGEVLDELFKKFASHLLLRVILVKPKNQSSVEAQRCLMWPMRSPGLPVSAIFLPWESEKLEWEFSHFFALAKRFSENCGKLVKLNSLTDREWVVANYIALGYTNKRISSLISFSEKTVEKCRSSLYSKLAIRSGPEMASLITFKNFYRWPLDVAFPGRQS